MGRAPCCDKANVKKGPWSPEEDAKLKSYIEKHGTGGNWIALPQKIGLKRCGKSCRLRWLNYLRPNIKHGGFSEEEDNIICSLYISIGSRWSIIAAQLPGRTDNDIKNYWNTKLKKKLLGKTRKEGRQSGTGGRRGGGREQEQKKPAMGESFQVLPPNQQQQTYWGGPMLPMPTFPSSTPSLLLDDPNPNPNPNPHNSQPMLDPSSIDLTPNSIAGYVTPIAPIDGNYWNFPTDRFEDDLYYNSMKLEGIEGLYDASNVLSGNNINVGALENVATTPPPMVFPPQVTGECYLQGVALHHGDHFVPDIHIAGSSL